MTTALPLLPRSPRPVTPWAWWSRLLRAARSEAGAGSPRAAAASSSWAASARESRATVDELYQARRLSLVRLAVLLVDDLATAEDIVQDVFTAMYRRHGSDLHRLSDPHAYLTTSVMNAARSALRRRRTARAYVPSRAGTSPAAEEQALLRDGDREVIAALQELTARQRQVVVLRYWSELSEAEIAETLRVSRGTVKATASRALAVLRRLLEQR